MIKGSVDDLRVAEEGDADRVPSIILGRVLAEKLKASLGDDVTVVAPLAGFNIETLTTSDEAPKSQIFRVVGVFYAGFDEYDRHLMYINISDSQALLGLGDKVQGLELKVSDVDAAASIAKGLERELGAGNYRVQDWHQLNRNLFAALKLQKLALVIILTLIIAVAAFNMVSALTMMVIDKTKEVAIMRSMGATSSGVARIFQTLGIGIGAVGTFFGLGIGLILCELMARYSYPLDPQVYLIDRLPIEISGVELAIVGGITMGICTLATLFPAARASSLLPVEGLRHD